MMLAVMLAQAPARGQISQQPARTGSEQLMNTVTTDRAGARHEYELRDEQGRPQAWLRTDWRLRSGEIRTEAGSWDLYDLTIRAGSKTAVIHTTS